MNDTGTPSDSPSGSTSDSDGPHYWSMVALAALTIAGLWALWWFDISKIGRSEVSWQFMAVASVGAALFYGYLIFREYLLQKNGVVVEAVVTSGGPIKMRGMADVRFAYDLEGQHYEVKQSIEKGEAAKLVAAGRATLLVDPKKPKRVTVK